MDIENIYIVDIPKEVYIIGVVIRDLFSTELNGKVVKYFCLDYSPSYDEAMEFCRYRYKRDTIEYPGVVSNYKLMLDSFEQFPKDKWRILDDDIYGYKDVIYFDHTDLGRIYVAWENCPVYSRNEH
jgi:hypothetical protein